MPHGIASTVQGLSFRSVSCAMDVKSTGASAVQGLSSRRSWTVSAMQSHLKAAPAIQGLLSWLHQLCKVLSLKPAPAGVRTHLAVQGSSRRAASLYIADKPHAGLVSQSCTCWAGVCIHGCTSVDLSTSCPRCLLGLGL